MCVCTCVSARAQAQVCARHCVDVEIREKCLQDSVRTPAQRKARSFLLLSQWCLQGFSADSPVSASFLSTAERRFPMCTATHSPPCGSRHGGGLASHAQQALLPDLCSPLWASNAFLLFTVVPVVARFCFVFFLRFYF